MNKRNEKQAPANPAQLAEAAFKKQQALALKAAGKDAEAIPLFKDALKLAPSLADIHFTLAMMAKNKPSLNIDMAAVNKSLLDKKALLVSYYQIIDILRSRRQHAEVLLCREEICRLMPDNAQAWLELGMAQKIMGQQDAGVISQAKALMLDPKDKMVKALFASACPATHIMSRYDKTVQDALQICFNNIYEANVMDAFGVWVGTALHNPKAGTLRSMDSGMSAEQFDLWTDKLTAEEAAIFRDRFFLDGLRLLIIGSPAFEMLLTRLRRYLCLHYKALEQNGRMALFAPLLCALAQQCFFNEFAFAQSPQEDAVIQDLLARRGSLSKTEVTLLACYEMLYEVFPETERSALTHFAAADQDFGQMLKVHILNPAEEERLKKDIAVFGDIANEISKNVRGQYEENPYPRWQAISLVPTPSDDTPVPEAERNKPYKILVAGCGTGRQAIAAAARHPQARVTAIDLSRASLAYGLRKAREAGIADRVDFIHADILSMKDWPEMFDMIECSGVLHHMEDPFAGWQALNSRLKPGGYFKIGLYSEVARRDVVKAQTYIKEHKFPATRAGIRAFREHIYALPATDTMRQALIGIGDFYTTSLVRDLVFHVQEHRMTLPQIQGMLDKLSLQCVRFTINSAEMLMLYDKSFPQDPHRTNLQNWHILEQKHPHLFIGMYQFWARKAV